MFHKKLRQGGGFSGSRHDRLALKPDGGFGDSKQGNSSGSRKSAPARLSMMSAVFINSLKPLDRVPPHSILTHGERPDQALSRTTVRPLAQGCGQKSHLMKGVVQRHRATRQTSVTEIARTPSFCKGGPALRADCLENQQDRAHRRCAGFGAVSDRTGRW